jgi:sulfur carrier protein ThiS
VALNKERTMKELNEKEKKLNELFKIIELNRSGYAGILSNGNIVDRREHPTAIPVQENEMLGTVKPKELIK